MKLPLMPQLTFYEREQIESFLRRHLSHKDIGHRLGRDRRVIDREITRNKSVHLPYMANSAQRIFEIRKRRKFKPKLEKYEYRNLRKVVIEKLQKDWSPDEIAGRLGKHLLPETNETISHESIYQYIYKGEGRYENLYQHLRTRRPKRQAKLNRRKRSCFVIENRISIHDRPEEIDNKERIGDWEDDSMIFSKQKNTLAVQYERKSMLCRLTKLPNKTAEEHENAIWQSIESLPNMFWHTITRDNGTENANHERTKEVFGIQSYYCDGYSSWQKGGVENLNKQVRQYLPRKLDLSKLTDEDITQIQERLNNRPRKNLGYLTPNEVIANFLKSQRGWAFTP